MNRSMAVTGILLALFFVSVGGVLGVVWFSDTAPALKQHILLYIQIPLLLTAFTVGAALSVSGATLQVLLRNPLADPGIIGITSGASLVAAVLLLLSPNWAMPYLHYVLPFGCFLGALMSTFVIYRIARRLMGSSTAVILSGIAISALSGAIIAWLNMYSDASALRNLTFWLMGSLYQSNWPVLAIGGPLIVGAVGLQLYYARDLNKLYGGDTAAKSSGVDVETLTERLLITSAVAVGAAVSMAGSIAFVGLLVPHVLRLLVGHNNRLILPLSALSGATLILLVALISEVTRAITLPVSLVTATLGGPLLIWALYNGVLKG